jgi:hypothetical protein
MTSLILSATSTGQRLSELLRQDTAGRVRTSKERRDLLLAQFDRSGVSGARFAKMAGIKYQTFANWLHMRQRAETRVPEPGFRQTKQDRSVLIWRNQPKPREHEKETHSRPFAEHFGLQQSGRGKTRET